MTKSQFNIKISEQLLKRIKRQAMMSGKTLTEHITFLVEKSLEEGSLEVSSDVAIKRIAQIEDRLLKIESVVSNREYLSKKISPFTDLEAIKCSEFMRGIFEKQFLEKNYKNKDEAFNDFIDFVNAYMTLNNFMIDRLKDVMLGDNSEPWTGEELNNLTSDGKCNCPIRKGLITWTGSFDFPSQQEICDKGADLL